MPASRSPYFLLLSALALVSGGCGGTNYPSSTVSGQVTIDGTAVPKGNIMFSPSDGTPGPVVGAPINNGEYRCEKVPQGKVHVTFIAQAAEPMKINDVVNKTTHDVPKDILPESCRKGQTTEIKAGENQLNFDLKSK